MARLLIVGLFFVLLPFPCVYGATLSLSSPSHTYTVGDQFDVSTVMSTEGEVMNAISMEVSFSNTYLDVVSASTDGSVLPFWIHPPTLAAGTVTFDGMIPNPGFAGSNAHIATIQFKALAVGTTTLSFTSASVLANDGLATELLSSTFPLTLVIKEKEVATTTPPEATSTPPEIPPEGTSTSPVAPGTPVITSATHPDQTVWYANPVADIAWGVPKSGVDAVRFGVSSDPNAFPSAEYASEKTQETLTLESGTWYVHVQFGNQGVWGSVGSYRINIDMEKPSRVDIVQIASDEIRVGTFSNNFSINAEDGLSGIDRVEVSIDGSESVSLSGSSPFTYRTSGLSAGEHTITATAYDRVGNSRTETVTFSLSAFDPTGIGNLVAPNVPGGGEIVQVGPIPYIETPGVVSIVSFAGFGAGFGQVMVFAGGAASLADLWMVALRFISSLLGFFRRRKKEPWGVVYDSVTKQPLDPAYVVVKKDGKQVGMAITDLDGRYGFLVAPGRYTIEAKKTHYVFPSEKLRGEKHDQFYDNLYFGGPIDIVDPNKDIVRYNIPLDPVGFDWNEFAKKERGIFYMHSKRKMLVRLFSNIVFFAGFAFSTYTLWYHPMLLNAVLFSMYAGIFLFQSFWKTSHPITKVMYALAKASVPFAIVKAYLAGSDMCIKTVVADDRGHFYILTPPGDYYFTVEAKQPDGSYSKKYQTKTVTLKKGVVLSNVYIKKDTGDDIL